MRILYVDDEADIREVAQLALALKTGWEVKTAPSGQDAAAILDTGGWTPDVMLLDVMMPRMDGPQTLKAVRQRKSAEDLPVIFITAGVLAPERERLVAAGAAGVIAKPFDPMRLAGSVTAILGRSA